MNLFVNYPEREKWLASEVERIIREQGVPVSDVLRFWPAYVQRRTLPRFLAHYELFKKTLDLPGSIAELGVYRGSSFFTWANLLETFCPNDRSRKVYGFDHFEGLRQDQFLEAADGLSDGTDGKKGGAYRTDAQPIRDLIRLHNEDNLLPGIERCILIEGDVFESVPKFLTENPGLRVNLLYFDMDLYRPTKFCLERLYPYVVPGGVVCFDEYGLIPWEGESRAVEEYFAGCLPRLRKIPFATTPGAYFIKE